MFVYPFGSAITYKQETIKYVIILLKYKKNYMFNLWNTIDEDFQVLF